MTMLATSALSAQLAPEQKANHTGAVTFAGFFAVEAGSSRPGKSIVVSDRRILVKVSGTDTGGSFALFECTCITLRMSTSMFSKGSWMFRSEQRLSV